jgi:SAM-dependent methyltransferase
MPAAVKSYMMRAEQYDAFRGSIFSEPYSLDMADRVVRLAPKRILETAAGTGFLSRMLASRLADCAIVATDISADMVGRANAIARVPNLEWCQADAQTLPFGAAEFDAVICQFSVVFFLSKARAYAEACRVLKPGGRFIFSVRDRIEANEFAALTARAVADLFPGNPPTFLQRIPYGYHDMAAIRGALAAAGFTHVETQLVTKLSRAASPQEAITAFCLGSPLRDEIEARNAALLKQATDAAADAVAARFGRTPLEGRMSAYVITATR